MISISSVRRRTVAAFAGCVALFASAFAFADSASTLPPSQTRLTLINGWKSGPGGTANASVSIIHGIVHFGGAIWTNGNNEFAFVLPAAMRPDTEVYAKVDLAFARNGRLDIYPNGATYVETEGSFSDAQAFTSLDGASFALNSVGFTDLSLINGWTEYGYGSANAAVKVISGIVQFHGAMATTGIDPHPFVLPAGFRPAKEVYLSVDMCNATNGWLDILPDGSVTVEAETAFSNAACFTSLDGVSFHK